MARERTVKVKITGDAKDALRAFSDTESGAGRMGTALGSAGRLAATAGVAGVAAVGAIGAASVSAFADFEQGMNEVFTLLPDATDDMKNDLTQGVKDIATEFGVLPSEIIPALYDSLSAGVPPDNVFAFLETGVQASIGGATDLGSAVDGITSVVNAYGSANIDAAGASDLMFSAVRLGKTTMEELSASLFNVLPTAAATNVSFDNVTAAMASMTAQGVPTSVATTQLRQLLVELTKDGSKASDAFREVAGVGMQEFLDNGNNMADVLEVMEQAADDNGVAIQDMFGSVEAGAAALALSGRNAEGFRANLAEMGSSAGATTAAFETMDTGLGRSFDKIKAAVAVVITDLGEKLAPVIGNVADFIIEKWPQVSAAFERAGEFIGPAVEFIRKVVQDLRQFWDENGAEIIRITLVVWERIRQIVEPAIELIKNVISVVMAIVRGDWEEAWQAIKDTIVSIWDTIAAIIDSAADLIKNAIPIALETLETVFRNVWEGLAGIAGEAWDDFVGWWEGVSETLAAAWDSFWQGLKDGVGSILGGIADVVKVPLNAVISYFETTINGVIGALNTAIRGLNVVNPFRDIPTVGTVSLPRLAQGGRVVTPGLALVGEGSVAGELVSLPAGATVFPSGRGVPAGGGGADTIVVTVELDGTTLWEAIAPAALRDIRVGSGFRGVNL